MVVTPVAETVEVEAEDDDAQAWLDSEDSTFPRELVCADHLLQHVKAAVETTAP